MGATFLLICFVITLPYGHTSVLQASSCLRQFEMNILVSSHDSIWMGKRDTFIANLKDNSTVDVLFEQLRKLEAHIHRDKLTEDWHKWKLNYWSVMTDSKLDSDKTVTRFIIALKFLEENLLRDAIFRHWIEQRHEKWLSDCSVLIDPLLQLSFYDDMYKEVNVLLKSFGCDSLEKFDNESTKVIYALHSVAKRVKQDLVTKGIKEIVFNLLSIIFTPFPVAGFAIEGLGIVVDEFLPDARIDLLAGNSTNKIIGETLALLHLIGNYAISADELKKMLGRLEFEEISEYATNLLNYSSKENSGPKTLKKAIRMWSIIKKLSQDSMTKKFAINQTLEYEIALPDFESPEVISEALTDAVTEELSQKYGKKLLSKFSKGISKVFKSFSPLVSVGYGIWGFTEVVNTIKSGPAIAQQYQHLATALTSAKRNILLAFDIDGDGAFEEGSLGTVYDANGRPEEWHRACFHGDTCMIVALLSYQVSGRESQKICRRYGLDLLVVKNKHISDIARGWLKQFQRSAWFSRFSEFIEYAPGYRRSSLKLCVHFSADDFYMAMSTDCSYKKSAVICG